MFLMRDFEWGSVMTRIKINVIESVATCTVFPFGGYFFTTALVVISCLYEKRFHIDRPFAIAYLASTLLLIVSLAICYIIIYTRHNNEIILFDDYFVIGDQSYYYSNIVSAKYVVCKWYMIPFMYFYKQGIGGLITLKTDRGRRIKFRVFYKDYKKIKNKILIFKEL